MINQVRDVLFVFRKRRQWRRVVRLRREFMARLQATFLARLEREGIVKPAETGLRLLRQPALRYGLIALAVIIALPGGAVVMATTTPVTPDSPFYSYQRLGESIQVQLTAVGQQPFVHQHLARRRLSEMKIVKAKQAESPALTQLARELGREVMLAVTAAERTALLTSQGPAFCGALQSLIEERAALVKTPISANRLAVFQKSCGPYLPANPKPELEKAE